MSRLQVKVREEFRLGEGRGATRGERIGKKVGWWETMYREMQEREKWERMKRGKQRAGNKANAGTSETLQWRNYSRVIILRWPS
eukprot:459320-Amorphochlora_amoeboformis.AAC.1